MVRQDLDGKDEFELNGQETGGLHLEGFPRMFMSTKLESKTIIELHHRPTRFEFSGKGGHHRSS